MDEIKARLVELIVREEGRSAVVRLEHGVARKLTIKRLSALDAVHGTLCAKDCEWCADVKAVIKKNREAA